MKGSMDYAIRNLDYMIRLCLLQDSLGKSYYFNSSSGDPIWNVAYSRGTYELLKTTRFTSICLCSDGLVNPVDQLPVRQKLRVHSNDEDFLDGFKILVLVKRILMISLASIICRTQLMRGWLSYLVTSQTQHLLAS